MLLFRVQTHITVFIFRYDNDNSITYTSSRWWSNMYAISITEKLSNQKLKNNCNYCTIELLEARVALELAKGPDSHGKLHWSNFSSGLALEVTSKQFHVLLGQHMILYLIQALLNQYTCCLKTVLKTVGYFFKIECPCGDVSMLWYICLLSYCIHGQNILLPRHWFHENEVSVCIPATILKEQFNLKEICLVPVLLF